jgi:hypothetical protein
MVVGVVVDTEVVSPVVFERERRKSEKFK